MFKNNIVKNMLIGICAGFISGFFGAGGGMILVPAFVYILKMDEKEARATSVFCILPMVLTSSFFYLKNNYIDWNLGIKSAVGGAIGGILGAFALNKLSNSILKVLFILFLVYIAFKMILF